VSTDEKSVNTLWSQSITPAAAASSSSAAGAPCNSADEDTAADNSLMARRRRRRERAQTAYIMHAGQSVDGLVQPSSIIMMPGQHHHQQQQPVGSVEGHQMTLAERRLLRAAASYSFHSLDNDDVFYDALNNSTQKPQQL